MTNAISNVVDVVIPVFGSLGLTRRCINSVLSSRQATLYELVVIDDASPEPEVSIFLATLAKYEGVTVIRNAKNLGFVKSANLGMALHPERDVVLLNSDTEVANDWLDRLRACAYGNPTIGLVSPFSNNATICSYPVFCADNNLPGAVDLESLDGLFSRLNANVQIEIPTAVGFCMYVKRACLVDVGLFDESRFGRGYGEENDLSRRAAKAGWKAVLSADTFVYHSGGASFQSERLHLMESASRVLLGLHPDYNDLVAAFCKLDMPARYRRNVDIAIARRRMSLGEAGGGDRHRFLHVMHSLGGGVERWVRDFCASDDAGENLVLAPYSCGDARGEGLILYLGGKTLTPLAFWRFENAIEVCVTEHHEYRRVISEVIDQFDIDAILVSSLIGHALQILRTQLPTLVVQHDYFPACPAINLHYQNVCRQCSDELMAECEALNPYLKPFGNYPVPIRKAVREQYLELIKRNNVTVVTPDESVRSALQQVFPASGQAWFVNIPHGIDAATQEPLKLAEEPSEKLRIVVLGALPVHKGLLLLTRILSQVLEFADLYLVGANEYGEIFRGMPGVYVVETYSAFALPEFIAEIKPDVGLLPSIVPETFSYTLSELFQLGIPPVASRLGAFSTRIAHIETGYLFDPDAEAMLSCLRDIHHDRNTLGLVRETIGRLTFRTTSEMVADYHQLLAGNRILKRNTVQQVVNELTGAYRGRELEVGLEAVSNRKILDSLRLKLELQKQRFNVIRTEQNESSEFLLSVEKKVLDIQAELVVKEQFVAYREAEIDRIYASHSWRITRGLRWAGKVLRGVRSRYFSGIYAPTRLQAERAENRSFLASEGEPGLFGGGYPLSSQQIYLGYCESLTPETWDAIGARIESLHTKPLISVVVPVKTANTIDVRAIVESVLSQCYVLWELYLVADRKSLASLKTMLDDYVHKDARIRFCVCPDGHSIEVNRVLGRLASDIVVLMTDHDRLEKIALFRIAEAAIENRAEMIYSDDVVMSETRGEVMGFHFRPAYSKEYLRTAAYIGNVVAFRTDVMRRLGGLDQKLSTLENYDLILRAVEVVRQIVHIPEILYSTRIEPQHDGPQGGYVRQGIRKQILQRHLLRLGESGTVGDGAIPHTLDVRYDFPPSLKVAVLIPTKNQADLVQKCIASIERTVADVRYEIVLIDHDSDEPEALTLFASLETRLTVLRYRGVFNFSAINNWAVKQLDGSHTHYLFCNNDIEATEFGWLNRLVEHAQKPDVGIAGAKLLYPDGMTLQHAGVVVACCGVAENLGRGLPLEQSGQEPDYMNILSTSREVSAVTAACMLIKRSAFEEVGGFDENLAVGYGDVDLSLRVRQCGYRVIYCSKAVLLHHESYSRGRSEVDPHPLDSAYFVTKWGGFYSVGDPYYNPNLSLYIPNWKPSDQAKFEIDTPKRTTVLNSKFCFT